MAKDAKTVLIDSTDITTTGTTTGSAFDCKTVAGNFPRGLTAALLWTAKGGTTPTLTLSIEMSDTSGFSTVRRTITRDVVTDALGEYFLSFTGPYRYIRAKVVRGGTNPTATFRVDLIQGAK